MAEEAKDDKKAEKNSKPEYELVPYKEIEELKHELQRLKEFPVPTGKRMLLAVDDLAVKISRLTAIFEHAEQQIEKEEGGLTFKEKMKPLQQKMNKIVEQNSEIAKGILALADLINELKGRLEKGVVTEKVVVPANQVMPKPAGLPPLPPTPGVPPPGAPLPPPPAKKRRFF